MKLLALQKLRCTTMAQRIVPVNKSDSNFQDWYRKAADQGNAKAKDRLMELEKYPVSRR